jgi:hypothetical protein
MAHAARRVVWSARCMGTVDCLNTSSLCQAGCHGGHMDDSLAAVLRFCRHSPAVIARRCLDAASSWCKARPVLLTVIACVLPLVCVQDNLGHQPLEAAGLCSAEAAGEQPKARGQHAQIGFAAKISKPFSCSPAGAHCMQGKVHVLSRKMRLLPLVQLHALLGDNETAAPCVLCWCATL